MRENMQKKIRKEEDMPACSKNSGGSANTERRRLYDGKE